MRRDVLLWLVVLCLGVAGVGQTLSTRARVLGLAAQLDAERAERAKVVSALEHAVEQERADVFRLRVAVLDAANDVRVAQARVAKLERWRRFIYP